MYVCSVYVCMHVYIPSYLHSHIRACIHTYIHISINERNIPLHTHIPTYMCINTLIYTYTRRVRNPWMKRISGSSWYTVCMIACACVYSMRHVGYYQHYVCVYACITLLISISMFECWYSHMWWAGIILCVCVNSSLRVYIRMYVRNRKSVFVCCSVYKYDKRDNMHIYTHIYIHLYVYSYIPYIHMHELEYTKPHRGLWMAPRATPPKWICWNKRAKLTI